MPEDVAVTTFARLEVSDIFRDNQNSQTLVRLNSKPEFESLDVGDKIALIFALESAAGGTDVKNYAENNAITAEFFHERHSCRTGTLSIRKFFEDNGLSPRQEIFTLS